jgi:putative ABC transport system substrate-binding protein
VIHASGEAAVRAAKEATRTIPIVMTAVDPVGSHFVASLARPRGNVTGVVAVVGELVPRRFPMLREGVPRASRVGVMASGPGGSSACPQRRSVSLTHSLETCHEW